MSSNAPQHKPAGVSILTETKLRLNPNAQLVTVKKKTGKYVDELWLKFLIEAGVLDSYELSTAGDETEIELNFTVEN